MPDESMPLVPLPGSQLARQGSAGSGRILDDMVSGALTTSQKEGALIPRYCIGDIDFCEPDYRQILQWAQNANLSPSDLLAALTDEDELYFLGTSKFVEGGRLKNIVWNTSKLPGFALDYGGSLEINTLCFWDGSWPPRPPLCDPPPPIPPRLKRYYCKDLIDRLSAAYHEIAAETGCEWQANQHIKLNCPSLQELAIEGTLPTNLEPINLPTLKEVWITGRSSDSSVSSKNFIESLNSQKCPELRSFNVNSLRLSDLDLNDFDGLVDLRCSGCSLDYLWVEQLSCLRSLNCSENELQFLSLVFCESLTELDCSFNHIAELDLRFNPEIRILHCQGNMIEELDIRPLQYLLWITYDRDRTRLIQRPDQNF